MKILPCLTVLALLAPALFAAKRTNVVLIMADDMGYECVSANGGAPYKTPNIDRLAGAGMRFTNCHSQPICTPSRVQIMTGIYNHRNYLKFGVLDPNAVTFGNLFKDAGYKTCVAGKWQLLGDFEGPNNFGFDEYCLWQLNRRPNRYPNPGFEINGEPVDFNNGEYGPDVATDYLCDFMERNKDEPFFAYYPMILPHWPFLPTPDSPEYNNGAKVPQEDRYFVDMVAYTDKLVGKLSDKLHELGIAENTLFIFTCDNGTYVKITSQLDEENYKGGKGSTKDNGTHVPMVAYWPGTIKPGQVSDALVDFSDIIPTITEAARVPVPENLGLRGHSFAPLLQGKPFTPREWIYCWYHRNGSRPTENNPAIKYSEHVRTEHYKLYRDGTFFDVKNDFGENEPIDLENLPEQLSGTYAKLKSVMDEYKALTKDYNPLIVARLNELFPPPPPPPPESETVAEPGTEEATEATPDNETKKKKKKKPGNKKKQNNNDNTKKQ